MGDMQIVLTRGKIEAQYVEMKVPLYSYGCEKKIKKALSNLKGIHSVQVDYQQQKVTVWGICNRDDVLAAVRKKRRAARFWGADEPGPGGAGTRRPWWTRPSSTWRRSPRTGVRRLGRSSSL
ncbi:hypothetical protein PR202_ga19264 [Eleusine coracana subsp. coracana]|uniref:HMA domain-containing protein n=1 Tax=Eleusine coracana subsp. coracana TaxID=191504 RepID=A0AAV5CVR3_ELECO|nr:hypothetical protein PR202_ga19264 [Eleusine coracana subsp. coracana]